MPAELHNCITRVPLTRGTEPFVIVHSAPNGECENEFLYLGFTEHLKDVIPMASIDQPAVIVLERWDDGLPYPSWMPASRSDYFHIAEKP